MPKNLSSLKIKTLTIFSSMVFLTGVSFLVLKAEEEKRGKKYLDEKKFYSDQYGAWEIYKKEYEQQVQSLRTENNLKMEESKKRYEDLLSKQPALVAQHTRTVKDSSYVPPATSVGAVVSSGGSKTTTITVSKPKSSTKTKTS